MVILNQIQNKIQSRGSGFVTFRKEKALLRGSNWKTGGSVRDSKVDEISRMFDGNFTKYDEDSKSGETIMPVKFEVNGVDLAEIQGGESTITKKAFRISSEVARVHKSI